MEPPSFPAGGPQTVRAAPGSDAHLVLPSPSGTPPFQYQWSRAGASLEGRFTSTEEAGAVRLTVSAARTDDTALYTLQASNAAGSDTARVRLEVAADEAPVGEDPPTFLRRLQDLTVKVGTRTRFLVEILSNTECKVTWYRNERRLLDAERVSLARDGNFWCADVAAVSVDDAGRWTCTAENAAGRATCSAHLNVLVPKAYKRPEFVEELRALLTELGTVSLECKVVGVPTPVLRWFKDSREIKAGDVFALTANADDPTSLGTYTCEAVNCMGRAYSSSKVHVVGRASREGSTRPISSGMSPEPPPIFTRELEDQFTRICEPLTLACQVVVPPWPRSVVWYNKEGKVEPSDRYHVLEDGVGGYMLEIPSAEWADEGEWKCVATSSGGRVGISTCLVTMDVPKNYRKPRFMENLQAVLTEEGLVSFECKVVGFPTPVLSWFKDGQELKPGDVYQLTGTNSLGSYCCIARNCMGQASSSAELTVEDIQNQLNEEEKLQLFSKNQAPKFVQGLKSVESKIDEPFRFTVKVAIPPEPSVLWYRDDQPVDESTRCHLGKEERGVFFLDIQNLEFLDQAEWKCVAMNDFGHSVTSCFLKLIIPRHYKKPRFLENLQAILSDEGAVNLECKVIGVPQPVLKWYKDGEELKPGDIHRIISGQDGTCCLGTYTCEASNCMGVAASSASLLGFEDSMKVKEKKKAEEQALQRNLSLSTIHEERTSQMYDTPVGDITLDDKGEISFSFDGKEVSVSLYETPDLTEEEALQIVEMYADQLSENVTEHNVVELPPLRFVKETSTSGNLLMEAIIIDVSPEYFTSPEEDLRTEADVDDISIADENGPPQLSLDQDVDIAGEDYLEKTMALLSEERADPTLKLIRKKSDSQRSAEDFFSLSRDQSLSEEKKDDDTQALSESELQSFASAHSSGKPKSKSSKPSGEDGQESSEPTKTILFKDDTRKSVEPEQVLEQAPAAVKPKRERRTSRSSRRSSSGSEKSLSRSKEEPVRVTTEIKAEVEIPKKPSMTNEEFKEQMSTVSTSLTKVINDVQLIERDIILKSELMSSAATASRSLEIISSLITPLSEIHSITDAAKESAMESKELSSTLFNSLPQSLKSLHQSLTIIEKCIDVESDNKTLVKKTCVSFIETCGAEMQKLISDIKAVIKTDYLVTNEAVLLEIDSLSNEMSTVIKFSADTIKARNLLSEASEIKVEEPSLETKHLRDTQKAVFELRSPLNSLLRIIECADSEKTVKVSIIKISDVILNDMSASIQDLQTSLEQIESLSVKESTSPSLQKYNTEIIETVVESILKLRNSFEQLSADTRIDNKPVLKETLKSIKENLNEISTRIDVIERNVGTFDILQSDNKLDMLQKMAQILIALENNLPRLETMPDVKTHMEAFHKNLTKILENVIESNEAKKYFNLMEICDAVNRINTSIKDIDTENVLPLASLSNTLTIIKDNFINNVFDSELNCSVLSNITDILVGIQEGINKAEEISFQVDSEHVQDLPAQVFDAPRANVVVEHIDQTIAAINTVRTIESTSETITKVAPVLKNICPVLEDLRKYIASVSTGIIEHDEHISDISEASFAETLATPLCELNQNLMVLNQTIVENIESLKENSAIISAVAEPLHELQKTLEVIQQEVISQYGEDLTPYEISVNMASAVQNLQSCILMIEEQAGIEGADEMSTLEDISGIKTTAETIASDRFILPTAEETTIEQTIEPFSEEMPRSAVAEALHTLNEHVALLQNPEILDALDTLSEVSDYSSLKSVALGLGELHSGIQEILHPLIMEGSSEFPNLINTSKLAVIAEPLHELHQSLSVLEMNNIPIYENILELPAEKLHSVFEKITDFKEHLDKCMQAIFPAIELADQSIEISNKVGNLRQVCEHLKDIIAVTKDHSLDVPTSKEVKALEEAVDNLLEATDVSKGIKIEQVKVITADLLEKVIEAQEELIQFTPQSPEILAKEAKLIDGIDEVENNIAVLQQYDFVDLSRVSDITSCTSPQLAMEIETDSLIQIEDIAENAVNIVQDSNQDMPIADLLIVEDFFKICKNEFTILRCLISKASSHKKIVRLLQEFHTLQTTVEEFKAKKCKLNLSDDVNACLAAFLSHADDSLKSVQTSLVNIVTSQSEFLFKEPATELDTSVETLNKLIQDKKGSQFQETFAKLVNVVQVTKPCMENIQASVVKELQNPSDTQTHEENIVTQTMEGFTEFIEEQIKKSSSTATSETIEAMLKCIQKHQDYRDATPTGKVLIILKCLSRCAGLLQEGIIGYKLNDIAEHRVDEVTLKEVLTEMLEPLQALHSQLVDVQEQILSGVQEDSISIDIDSTESLVKTMTEVHRDIIHKIELDSTQVESEELTLIMEVDKEISSIHDTLKSVGNLQATQAVVEIVKPMEDIEKSLKEIITEKLVIKSKEKLPKEKAAALVQHIDQYIELIEIVEEISAIIKIEDLKEAVDIAKELRESISTSEPMEIQETGEVMHEISSEQARLALKLQKALMSLHVQVLDSAQELAPELGAGVLQRIAKVTAQLQADLVAVTGVQVAVQAPSELLHETAITAEVLVKEISVKEPEVSVQEKIEVVLDTVEAGQVVVIEGAIQLADEHAELASVEKVTITDSVKLVADTEETVLMEDLVETTDEQANLATVEEFIVQDTERTVAECKEVVVTEEVSQETDAPAKTVPVEEITVQAIDKTVAEFGEVIALEEVSQAVEKRADITKHEEVTMRDIEKSIAETGEVVITEGISQITVKQAEITPIEEVTIQDTGKIVADSGEREVAIGEDVRQIADKQVEIASIGEVIQGTEKSVAESEKVIVMEEITLEKFKQIETTTIDEITIPATAKTVAESEEVVVTENVSQEINKQAEITTVEPITIQDIEKTVAESRVEILTEEASQGEGKPAELATVEEVITQNIEKAVAVSGEVVVAAEVAQAKNEQEEIISVDGITVQDAEKLVAVSSEITVIEDVKSSPEEVNEERNATKIQTTAVDVTETVVVEQTDIVQLSTIEEGLLTQVQQTVHSDSILSEEKSATEQVGAAPDKETVSLLQEKVPIESGIEDTVEETAPADVKVLEAESDRTKLKSSEGLTAVETTEITPVEEFIDIDTKEATSEKVVVSVAEQVSAEIQEVVPSDDILDMSIVDSAIKSELEQVTEPIPDTNDIKVQEVLAIQHEKVTEQISEQATSTTQDVIVSGSAEFQVVDSPAVEITEPVILEEVEKTVSKETDISVATISEDLVQTVQEAVAVVDSQISKEISTEPIQTVAIEQTAIETKEDVVVEQTGITKTVEVTKEEASVEVAEVLSVAVASEAASLLAEIASEAEKTVAQVQDMKEDVVGDEKVEAVVAAHPVPVIETVQSIEKLFQHIEEYVSENAVETVEEIFGTTVAEELKNSIITAKELKESIETAQANVIEATGAMPEITEEQIRIAQQLQLALSVIHQQALESLEKCQEMSKVSLEKIIEVTENLKADLIAVVNVKEVLEHIEDQATHVKESKSLVSEQPAAEEPIGVTIQQTTIVSDTQKNEETNQLVTEAKDISIIDEIKTDENERLVAAKETTLLESIEPSIPKPEEIKVEAIDTDKVTSEVMEPIETTEIKYVEIGEALELKKEEILQTVAVSQEAEPVKFEVVSVEKSETIALERARESSEDALVRASVEQNLIQHIDELISNELSEAIESISLVTSNEGLKESVVVAKELRECVAAVITTAGEEAGVMPESGEGKAQLAQKLLDSLVVLNTQILNNAQELAPIIETDTLEKVASVITHLKEDLQSAVVVFEPGVKVADIRKSADVSDEDSMKRLEILLQEVNDKIDLTTTNHDAEDKEALRDTLDEVQTVVIKLKRDYDGAVNDTLNEALEDLECSVRSVQLQINEDSPPELLKEACATLQLLLNNMSETQSIEVSEAVLKDKKYQTILDKCSDETHETMVLLEKACKIDAPTGSNLNNILVDMNKLKDTIKTLRLNFLSDPHTLIDRGIDVTQSLDQIEDKVYALEKDIDIERQISPEVRDCIITAIHSVYGSISNMRSTISSIQKRYMFENYGQPSETLLRTIKNVTDISKLDEESHKQNWKKFSKSLRKVLNHFEDVKFYINLDKTARLPSDAAFTKIILEDLKACINEVIVTHDIMNIAEGNKKVQDTIKSVEKYLQSIESKSTLDVKDKIPIFKDIASRIYGVSDIIKKNLEQEEIKALAVEYNASQNEQVMEVASKMSASVQTGESEKQKQPIPWKESQEETKTESISDLTQQEDQTTHIKSEEITAEIVKEMVAESIETKELEGVVSIKQEDIEAEAVLQTVEQSALQEISEESVEVKTDVDEIVEKLASTSDVQKELQKDEYVKETTLKQDQHEQLLDLKAAAVQPTDKSKAASDQEPTTCKDVVLSEDLAKSETKDTQVKESVTEPEKTDKERVVKKETETRSVQDEKETEKIAIQDTRKECDWLEDRKSLPNTSVATASSKQEEEKCRPKEQEIAPQKQAAVEKVFEEDKGQEGKPSGESVDKTEKTKVLKKKSPKKKIKSQEKTPSKEEKSKSPEQKEGEKQESPESSKKTSKKDDEVDVVDEENKSRADGETSPKKEPEKPKKRKLSKKKSKEKEETTALLIQSDGIEKEDKGLEVKEPSPEGTICEIKKSHDDKNSDEGKLKRDEEKLAQEKLEKDRLEREELAQQILVEKVKKETQEEVLLKEKNERDKIKNEILETEAHEKDKLEKQILENKRLEREKQEKEKLEQEKREEEKLEQETLAKDKLEKEKHETQESDKENLEKEKQDRAKLVKENLEREKLEEEKLEKQKLEERIEREKLEKEKLEKEKLEKEKLEKEKHEKEKLEKEKIEKEKFIKEKLEKEKLEKEKQEKEKSEKEKREKEKLEKEKLEREKLEKEKLENEKLEKEKLEKEKLEKEKQEKEKSEKEKRDKEKLEKKKLEKEKLEKEKLENEKLEKEKLEKEKLEKEKQEKEKLEKEKREKEKLEKEKLEKEKLEKEKLEKEKLEKEKQEKEKLEKEILEKKKMEKETLEKEKQEKEKSEKEKRVKEKLEKEKLEKEKLVKEKLEKEKLEKEKLEKEKQEKEKLEQEKLAKETLEKEMLENQKLDKERLEREKQEKEKIEKEKLEKQKLDKEILKKEKQEQERLEKEKQEKEKLEKEKLEKEKLEKEKQEKEKLEQEKLKKERLEKEKLEKQKLEKEILEKEKQEKERLEKEKLEKEKLEKEKQEKEKLEQEKLEKEKIEKEKLEKQKLEKQKQEKERLEKEKHEKEKLEKEKLEKEKQEKEKHEKEKLEKEKLEKEKLEREKLEKENLEKEKIEKDRLENEKIEKEKLRKEKRERLKKAREEKERLERELIENAKQDKEKTQKEKLEKEENDKKILKKDKFENDQEKQKQEKLEKEKAGKSLILEEEITKTAPKETEIPEKKKTIKKKSKDDEKPTPGRELEREETKKIKPKTQSESIGEQKSLDQDEIVTKATKKTENGEVSRPDWDDGAYKHETLHRPDVREKTTFVDHNHRDFTMEFARPSAYRERTFDDRPENSDYLSLGKSATIYKAETIYLDSQLKAPAPPYSDLRSSEPRERRELRQRSKALSETRSMVSERRTGSRDLKRKPVFSTYLTDRTAVEGSRVKLTCSALSSTEPNITWYKNGVILDNKLKYRTKFVDGLITLEVLNAVPSDSAEYSCTVENENGSISTSANLKVYPSFEASPIPPTFTRSIRDTYHLADDELILECRIRGQPLPTISWLKDDRPVSSDRHQAYYLADGVCRLAILHPKPEDSGKYTCRAENSMWSDQITHVVNFTGRESRLSPNLATVERSRFNRHALESRRPHFGNVLADYQVVKGGTIGLQVEIRGCPTRVEWLREGRSVTDVYRNARTFVEQGLYTLALSDVTEKESGLYTCRAWSTHGNVDMNAAITVVQPNELDGKPAIIIGRPEKDILISVGEDINISFRVQGEPKPKVIFMKGIRDITTSQRVCKMTSDDYVKFTVKRSVVSDAGTYCILARNAYGCDRAFVTVVVRQRASSENLISDWTYPLDDTALSISERKYKSVPDRIPGEPSVVDGGNNWLSLAWPKPDPGAVAPVLAYKVESWLIGKEGGARWTELGITPLNSFDAFNLKQGEEYHFRVTPRNRYGWGEPVQTSTPIGVGLAGARPEFVDILPGQLKVLAGETANLSCSVKGKPIPEVVWMKNGHEIEEEARMATSFNGYDCCLTIKDINTEDDGRYSCEASNMHGRASTYARLAVVTDRLIWEADVKLKRERSQGVEGEYPPQFTMRLRDRRVQATYPVRLTCQVVGNPPPTLTWYKDGQEVATDNRHNKYQDEHFHTLEIAPTNLEDGGVYEALARNPFGAVSCRCSLVVDKGIRAYVAPEFCCGLEPLYKLNEGDELRISAVVEAYPSVGVTWYRDGVRLRPNRRAIMTLDRDGQIELALAAVTPRDAGVYMCTASNEVGRASTSGKVEVVAGRTDDSDKKPPAVVISCDVPYSKEPMFIRKPRSSEAREGDTVIIECEVVGDPKPDVYWLRDFLKPDYYRDATHFKRVGDGPEYRFEIPHAKLDYTGAYSVVARNVHGEAKAVISLQILAKDPSATEETHNVRYGRVEVIPRFERNLTDLLSYDGDAVEFECRVSGNPEPYVRWFHYNEIIRDCPDFEALYEDGAARLKIKQVTAEDEGTYTCEAANCLGKARSSACLVVYPPGEPNTLSQRLRRPPALLSAASTPRSTPRSTPARSVSRTPGPEPRRLCSPARQMAPAFYTYPFNKVVEEGDSVVFQCAVKGQPAPWTTWDKDGIILTPTARITIKEKDEILRILEIDEVTIEDVGIYKITVENEFGRAEASARLEVITRKGKFYAGVRAYSASPRRSLGYRRRASTPRQD